MAALQRALQRHVPDVAGFLPLGFSLSDADELRTYLTSAGFAAVSIRIEINSVRFSSVEHFLNTYFGSTPVAGVIGALPRDRRAALGEEVPSRSETTSMARA